MPACASWSAPPLFSIKEINAAEHAAELRTQVELRDHPDRKGADISGKMYAFDRVLYDSLQQVSRAGGMSTTAVQSRTRDEKMTLSPSFGRC